LFWRNEYEQANAGRLITVNPSLKACWNATLKAVLKIQHPAFFNLGYGIDMQIDLIGKI